MKVYICKFFNEDEVKDRVARLVFNKRKQAGNVKVFCVDEHIRLRLESVGIDSEVVDDFHKTGGADDEPSWEKAYQILDRLHSSAENDHSLKYSGINLLAVEYSMVVYVLAVKFSNLCKRMQQQKCEMLILVLTKLPATWFPDINSPKVKTLKYGSLIERLLPTRIYQYAKSQFPSLMRYPFIRATKWAKRLTARARVSPVKVTEPPRKLASTQRVLFVVTSPLYARPALAISKECRQNGVVPYIATDELSMMPILKRYNIEHCWINPILIALSTLPTRYMLMFYRHRNNLREHINSFYDKSNDFKDEFSAGNLFRGIRLNSLTLFCAMAISNIVFIERLIRNLSPDLICLMPDGNFPQHIASALAKKHSIPILACSAALENGNARSHMRHLNADKLAAMGEITRKLYIDSGIAPDRVLVTGIAHFDLLFNRDEEKDNQALLECSIDPDKRIILFTTDNISFSETERMLQGVIIAILKMKDTQLVVKIHPSEEIGAYLALAEEYRDPRIRVVKDIDLYALISNCQLLITKYSTTALESMIIDKPVVVINLSGQPTPVPYAEEGAALGVYRYEGIEQAIQKALYDEETQTRLEKGREQFVRNWAGEPDGKASQRIVTLMKEMVSSR